MLGPADRGAPVRPARKVLAALAGATLTALLGAALAARLLRRGGGAAGQHAAESVSPAPATPVKAPPNDASSFFRRLAGVATNHPWRAIATVVLITVVGAALTPGLAQRLSMRGFHDPSSESSRADERLERATGTDPNGSVVAMVKVSHGVDTPDGRRRVAVVAKQLTTDADMGAVVTPFTGAKPNPALIARDGKSAFILGSLKPGRIEGDAADRIRERFADQPDVRLGGFLIASNLVSHTVEDDLRRAEMIAFPLLFLLSLIVFRGLIAAALPLMVGGITIPLTFAAISGFDQITDLSVFALNLTTGLGLGLAIDYSLLLVSRFREELENGHDKATAVRITVSTSGRTIVFSALTVAGSIAALGIFPLKFLYSMAFAGAAVALIAAAVALTLVPAVLMLLGPRINSLSLARNPLEHSTTRWRRLAVAVMRRPGRVAIVTASVLLLAGLPLLRIDFTSVDATVLPAESSAHQVELAMLQLPPSELNSSLTAVVKAGERDSARVARLARQFDRLPDVKAVAPPRYLGKRTWRVEVFPDGSRYSPAAQRVTQDTRDLAARWQSTDGQVLTAGYSSIFIDQRAAIIRRAPVAILLIGLITFVVLFLMTGSVVLPIKTFAMNLLTLSATFGILVLIFQDGRFEGFLDYNSQNAIELTQPVLLFATAFGLATDYGVFLLSRIKELYDSGLSNRQAVIEGVARTGRVITSAALLFCVAIGAFATSDIIFIKILGVGTALAVAIDATIVRALLVPSLMALLGKWNWWAPKPLARLHQRFGLSEGLRPAAPPARLAPERR